MITVEAVPIEDDRWEAKVHIFGQETYTLMSDFVSSEEAVRIGEQTVASALLKLIVKRDAQIVQRGY